MVLPLSTVSWLPCGLSVRIFQARSPGKFSHPAALGSFDSSVHISEEASNAAVAVPWGIVGAIAIAGVLGTGQFPRSNVASAYADTHAAINIALAFCMGTDLQGLYDSDQPMADIFVQSFGRNATLGIWAIVVIVQYMMGSSMLLSASRQTFAFSRDGGTYLSHLGRLCSRIGLLISVPFYPPSTSILRLGLSHEQIHRHTCQLCVVLFDPVYLDGGSCVCR